MKALVNNADDYSFFSNPYSNPINQDMESSDKKAKDYPSQRENPPTKKQKDRKKNSPVKQDKKPHSPLLFRKEIRLKEYISYNVSQKCPQK